MLLRGVIKPRKTVHHKILQQSELPAFLKAVDEYSGYFVNRLALRLAILTLARSNEVLQSTWNEFDLNNAVWTKPAAILAESVVDAVRRVFRISFPVLRYRQDEALTGAHRADTDPGRRSRRAGPATCRPGR